MEENKKVCSFAVMVSFPNAKINLGLHVIARRTDGYHEIDTVFYPVDWVDALEMIPLKSGLPSSFTVEGAEMDTDNICSKAYSLLRKEFKLPPIQCFLQKNIPLGAGLGGGSSDAASVIMMANDLFACNMNKNKMAELAAQLGSDCPFFIYNKPMHAAGRGEELNEIKVSLKKYFITIVMPPVHVSTADAYNMVKPAQPEVPLEAVIMLPVAQWKYALKNDFEETVFEKFPVIKSVKDKLYIEGAMYSSMSGSGAAVYGIFERPVDLKQVFPGCRIWSGMMDH